MTESCGYVGTPATFCRVAKAAPAFLVRARRNLRTPVGSQFCSGRQVRARQPERERPGLDVPVAKMSFGGITNSNALRGRSHGPCWPCVLVRSLPWAMTLLLWGCCQYTIRFTMAPTGSGDENTQAEVLAGVSAVADRFGLIRDPDVERASAEHWGYGDRIIGDYSRGSDRETRYATIILWVGIHKETGELTVVIRDLRHGSHTEFTQELEDALLAALSARLPSYNFEVRRYWEVPITPM